MRTKTEPKKAKGANKKGKTEEDGSKEQKIDDLDDDEDYDDEVDSQDNDFIADDDEVYEETMKARKREKRRLRLEEKEKGGKREESEDQLDDDDFDLIKENRTQKRKLKKMNEALEDSEEAVVKKVSPAKDQIESKAIKHEDDKRRANDNIKRNIFEKRDQTTASDDERRDIQQSLKDKFVTEEIDELFGTLQDQKIVEEDIPERLQIKLGGRFSPAEAELEKEAEWIFNIIIEELESSKDQNFTTRIAIIKKKIQMVLKFFRVENGDIPFITRYRQQELIPELEPHHVWRIFELDIEYGKFLIQKRQCEDFFTKIYEIASESTQKQIEHYKNQIFYTNNVRDLNDFSPLINFYKSYYQKELDEIVRNNGKKVPVQKSDMVYIARKHKLDEFSRRCMLSPIELQENLNEDKQIHKPTNPNNIGPTEMAKEYLRKETEGALDVIKDMCNFTAVELSSEPDIRRGLKKHIYEFGVIITEPTEKGKKELDVFHASYRTKRVNKRVSELLDTDLFIDILQNHSLGLITFDIVIKDDCQDDKIGNKYFQNMLEKYRFPDDTTKWRFLRREIFEIISSTVTNNRGQKSFLLSIVDEIKQELTEDAEKFVLRQSAEKYKALIQTGFFTLDNQRQNQDNDRRRPIEEDIIKQRERLTVMGAIMHPIDNRNFVTTIAVVDQFGELVDHKDFMFLLPPRKRGPLRDGQAPVMRPGEEDEMKRHDEDKKKFQEILREHQVDLIVVSSDCLEAKRLKKALSEFAMLNNQHDMMQDDNDDDRDNGQKKEAFVIWGRPEIPKLFASSHFSQKLCKNQPFVLKKAICLARWEQDPMNEVLNLWSPIMSENQALNIELHPFQKHINQARLLEKLEEINIQMVNSVGIDINLLVDHEHWHNQLQFLSGLGPRKAQKFIQKLKSLGKPLYTRNEIYEKKMMGKYCFISCFAQLKVRVLPEKRPEQFQYNILDQTRIHYRQYEHVYKVVADCMDDDFSGDNDLANFKKQQAVIEIIKDPTKLKQFAMNEYKEQIKKLDSVGMAYIFDQIIEDLIHPFRDPRENVEHVRNIANQDQRFSNKELFYNLIDETERTFKVGMIVSATVFRVYDQMGDKPARILCRLENGLDANIGEQDADFFAQNGGQLSNSIDVGSIVTGRIAMIKTGEGRNGEKVQGDDNFSVILKCKPQDIKRHDNYINQMDMDINQIPEEDLENYAYKVQEEQTQHQKKAQIQKRKIQHQRFQNITSTLAVQYLQKEDNGEFYFRPSSRGTDHLTLTWKFFENNIVHIDIQEADKAIGANIGSKLRISDESYENLQEIVERYIIPCNRSLREVIQHPKFLKCSSLDEIKKSLETEKQDESSRIPYRFTILEKYPQYVILAYIPKREMVKEFIKIKPRGYFFHHQYHYPFQNKINWFKQEFRTRDYQRYLRKTGSPQLARVADPHKAAAEKNPSNVPMGDGGMQIEQQNGAGWGEESQVKREDNRGGQGGYGRGQRRSSPPRNSGGGWGAESTDQSNIKDERDRGGAKWGGDNNDWGTKDQDMMQSPTRSDGGDGRGRGRGRGRGGAGGGGGGVCFKCQQEGHFARECPNPDAGGGRGSKGGQGRGRGGGACYKCQKEGHFARECPNEASGDQRGDQRRDQRGDQRDQGYKRQRADDGNSHHRRNEGESSWAADKNTNDGGWGNNQPGSQAPDKSEGGGWGAAASSKPSEGGGWGQAPQKPPPTAAASGAWGQENSQSQSNNQGGW